MTTESGDASTTPTAHSCGCNHAEGEPNAEANSQGGGSCCQDQPAPLAAPLADPLTREELAQLPIDALITRFRRGVENYAPRLFSMSDDLHDYPFADHVHAEHQTGLWSIRALLGHVTDAELVYAHRVRRAIAEDSPVNQNWDEQAFLDAGLYQGPIEGTPSPLTTVPSIAGFLAVTHTLRQWTAELLLGLNLDQWGRKLLHPLFGPMTLKELVALQTWHLEHHARFLNNKIGQLLGPEEAPSGCCQNQAAEQSHESSAETDTPANHTGCCNGSDA